MQNMTVIGFGPGTSSFSGKDSDETVTCLMDGREVVLSKSEFWKFLRMRYAEQPALEVS